MRADSAVIILYDQQDRVLLQHRSHDAPLMPDYWAFFGGRIQENETSREAVCREVFEEIGYRLREPRALFTYRYRQGGSWGQLHVFTENFTGDKSKLKLAEGQGWGWYRQAELAGLKMVSRDRSILRKFFCRIKGAV